MKKYTRPYINISEFETENIVTEPSMAYNQDLQELGATGQNVHLSQMDFSDLKFVY